MRLCVKMGEGKTDRNRDHRCRRQQVGNVDKTDYKILFDRVQKDVDAERARGGWDAH